MKKNIVIIHYNTPHLTECLVNSINLFVKDAIIYIFDNSDKQPFTAKFDNVAIIDNTKGQIINFNEWLENYPNRKKSGGRRNYWGSAKHCVSVEKCMEIIGESFILMDSDILLKKDCSDLFQEDCIYVGERQNQPTSRIDRILPFICFINTEMCKENGVHYFDDNYMHGLRKTASGDMYDTGAVLCKDAENLNHKYIKINDYIVHYNNASWMSTTLKKHMTTVDEWLKIHKKLWSTEKNKKVIYTCITGEYDQLIEPSFINYDFDYICFTDNQNLKSEVWDIRPLPKETEGLTQIKKQRYVKINAHKILPEYDLSIWVDGNVSIKSDLNVFIGKVLKEDCSIYVPKHPQRNCIYDEVRPVISMKKDIPENVNPQIERYRKEGFPKGYGLLQSNIMLRKHNDKDCIRLMEDWSNEVINGSHRDQLSFNYCCWKNQDIKVTYLDRNIYRSTWFNWLMTHKKGTYKPAKKIVSTRNFITDNNISISTNISNVRLNIAKLKENYKKTVERRKLKTIKQVNFYKY